MRAIANLAVSADYRPNILQAKALPLAVSMLRNAQLQGSGSHTFAVLCHAARAIGNLCAGGEIAAAMQQKAAAEARNSGAILRNSVRNSAQLFSRRTPSSCRGRSPCCSPC